MEVIVYWFDQNLPLFSLLINVLFINEMYCKVPKFNLRMQQYLIWMCIYDSYEPTSVMKAVSLIHGSYAHNNTLALRFLESCAGYVWLHETNVVRVLMGIIMALTHVVF